MRALFASGEIWIAKTVLLETGWVLGSFYGFGANAIHNALTALLGLGNVHVEDEASVINALALTEQGLEFADAMHLVSRPVGTTFVSFDQAFVRRAGRAGVPAVSIVPSA